MRSHTSQLRISGTGAPLFVPAFAIAAIVVIMPMYLEGQGEVLPAENLARIRYIAFAAVGMLALTALFCSSRSIELANRKLTYTSWLGTSEWAIEAFTDVTYEHDIFPEVVDNGPFHWVTYLRLWRGERKNLALNTLYWRKKDLAGVVQQLRLARPEIRVGPKARRYLGLEAR